MDAGNEYLKQQNATRRGATEASVRAVFGSNSGIGFYKAGEDDCFTNIGKSNGSEAKTNSKPAVNPKHE